MVKGKRTSGMPDPVYPPATWKSPDTYFHLVSAIVSSLILAEVFAPGSTAAKVVGCVALALQFLGFNVARSQVKYAINLPPPAPAALPPSSSQAGFIRFDTLCLFLFAGACGVAIVGIGCQSIGGKDAVRAGGHAVVDCGSKAAQDALTQYGPTVEAVYASATTNDGKLDKATFEQATTGFLAETGWCVAKNVLARILAHVPLPGAPQASPLQLDAADAQSVLGAIQEARYAGVTFKPAAP